MSDGRYGGEVQLGDGDGWDVRSDKGFGDVLGNQSGAQEEDVTEKILGLGLFALGRGQS